MDTVNSEKIKLIITGTQYPVWDDQKDERGGGEEPLVTVQEVEASFFQRGEAFYWLYEEQLEGHPHPYSTRMKYKGNVLELVRKTKHSASSMVFETGKSYRTEYMTPLGNMFLDIVTRSVERLNEESGAMELKVCYTLENEGQAVGEYELYIKG